MKVGWENPKTFQPKVQSAEQNLQKRFQLRSNDDDNPKGRTAELTEMDPIRQRQHVMSQGGTFAKTLF